VNGDREEDAVRTLVIAGLGPGALEMVPQETISLAKRAEKVFLRTQEHPSVEILRRERIPFTSFDSLYAEAEDFDRLYRNIADMVLESVRERNTMYIVPGNPLLGEKSVEMILDRVKLWDRKVLVKIVPAPGFAETVLSSLRMPVSGGYVVIDAYEIYRGQVPDSYPSGLPFLIYQVHDEFMASVVKLWLLEFLPPDYEVFLVTAAGIKGQEEIRNLTIEELDRRGAPGPLTTVVVPALGAERDSPNSIEGAWVSFLSVIRRLRAPNGCPWDREQTYRSLTRFLLEEAHEAVSAVFSEDPAKLAEELGDLLLEVGLYSQIASERGDFTVRDVLSGITCKLIRRHPHVFGHAVLRSPAEVEKRWAEIKRQEPGRYEEGHSLMDEIDKGLPALMRAQKQQVLASRVGFDWDSPLGIFEKIQEELGEVREAYDKGNPESIEGELGDLLFACVNLSRHLGVDAETALLSSVEKFSRRFRQMESYLKSHNLTMKDIDLASLDRLWEKAKESEDEKGG